MINERDIGRLKIMLIIDHKFIKSEIEKYELNSNSNEINPITYNFSMLIKNLDLNQMMNGKRILKD